MLHEQTTYRKKNLSLLHYYLFLYFTNIHLFFQVVLFFTYHGYVTPCNKIKVDSRTTYTKTTTTTTKTTTRTIITTNTKK